MVWYQFYFHFERGRRGLSQYREEGADGLLGPSPASNRPHFTGPYEH